MSALQLALREVRYVNLAFWRNPPAAFFTFFFPIMFMLIFNVLFGGTNQIGGTSGLRVADFYTPGIIVFSVITATYTNIAMSVTASRDLGVLKRVRGTPLPPVSFLAGRILHAVLIAFLLVVIVAAFGSLAYQVRFPWDRLPALVVTLAISAGSFCALGMAIAGFVPNADAAPAIVNFSILPLNFISNVFIDMRGTPDWINTVSRIFPIRRFADAMLGIYNPSSTGNGFYWTDLAVIAAWGLGGLILALRFFSWEPRR
jgi:ABC-2 type transport system permease protein